MRLKLDENIGRRGLALLKSEGHDVMTVREQGLGGTSDERLFEVCRDEERALVTLDRDFGQVMRFPPENSAGIVVLDQGPRATPGAVLDRLQDFSALLESRALTGELWIVELGRVRIHLRDNEK